MACAASNTSKMPWACPSCLRLTPLRYCRTSEGAWKREVARSVLAVPQSRIRELADIAMAMDGVLRLYFGESNQPTPQYIKDAAIGALREGYTFYTENAGLPSLRAGIARKYEEI